MYCRCATSCCDATHGVASLPSVAARCHAPCQHRRLHAPHSQLSVEQCAAGLMDAVFRQPPHRTQVLCRCFFRRCSCALLAACVKAEQRSDTGLRAERLYCIGGMTNSRVQLATVESLDPR